MKCINCGADYNVDEPCCPYCLTPNTYGQELKEEKNDAIHKYNEIKKNQLPDIKRQIANKILNRILVTEALLIGLIFFGSILIVVLSSVSSTFSVNFNKSNIKEQLSESYEEENFSKLYSILSKKELFGDAEFSGYAHMAFLYYDYNSFREERASFYNASKDEYYDVHDIRHLLSCINRVMTPTHYSTKTDLDEKNAEYSLKYSKEAYAFAAGSLKLTEEEIELLSTKHISTEALDNLADSIYERSPWNE